MATSARVGGDVIQFFAAGMASAPRDPSEKRGAPRRRVLKAGIMAYCDRHCTLPCTVRDISATGARLRSDSAVNAPDRFELIIELDGLEAECEVVWRKGDDMGVRFLSAPRKAAARRHQVIDAVTPERSPSLRRRPASADRS